MTSNSFLAFHSASFQKKLIAQSIAKWYIYQKSQEVGQISVSCDSFEEMRTGHYWKQ